jgi:hypothetical protein
MTMKRAELEKRDGLKIANELRRSGNRFGKPVSEVDRRAQRVRDRAAGLVPFAVKLHGDLIRKLHETAERRQVTLNELVDRLLRTGLTMEEASR